MKGYTEEEVRKMLGKDYKKFEKWMYGQGCGVDEKGNTIFWKHDVEKFMEKIGKPEGEKLCSRK
jgi:hypothetical protein